MTRTLITALCGITFGAPALACAVHDPLTLADISNGGTLIEGRLTEVVAQDDQSGGLSLIVDTAEGPVTIQFLDLGLTSGPPAPGDQPLLFVVNQMGDGLVLPSPICSSAAVFTATPTMRAALRFALAEPEAVRELELGSSIFGLMPDIAEVDSEFARTVLQWDRCTQAGGENCPLPTDS